MNNEGFQFVKVAIIPIAPLKIRGKQFCLKFVRISEIMKLLSEKQHFQVIVYSNTNPNGYEINGRYNSEKKRKLLSHLRQIYIQIPIDMPDAKQQLTIK